MFTLVDLVSSVKLSNHITNSEAVDAVSCKTLVFPPLPKPNEEDDWETVEDSKLDSMVLELVRESREVSCLLATSNKTCKKGRTCFIVARLGREKQER